MNVAIKYLKQVLEVEEEMVDCPTQSQDVAQSYVNICSIYSEMGKHDIALSYIVKAVDILDVEYEARFPHEFDEQDKV